MLELLARRAAAIPRLRMRVRDVLLPVGGAAWTADKGFDVRRHVREIAPLARGEALAVAMSPYGGKAHIGLVADGEAVPDLDTLAEALDTELELLESLGTTSR